MRKSVIVVLTCLAMGSLTLYGVAIAHDDEKHGEMSHTDAQMRKLHAMMPMFSLASAKMETALEKRDSAAVKIEGDKIIVAVPDLKKSKPHKNVSQKKKFVEFATNLETAVISTVNLAKNGDLAAAKSAFKKVEATCAACHATFRD